MISQSSEIPFWGVQSSRANFCEEDYVITRYIAEFINTLTNITYVIYAIYGIQQVRRNPTANIFRSIPYWGLMTVGVCSTAFHMSLKYHTQMLDDLSMLFTTTPVLHRALTVNATPRNSIILALVLGISLIGLVVYHVSTDEMILHAVSFGAMVVVIGVRTMQLINVRTPAGSSTRRRIWGVVRFGAFIFNMGYWLWLVDEWACGYLKRAREGVGLPWAFVLELHGWWHICTGIGAYIFIAVVDHLASGEDLEDIEMSLAWPAPWAARSIFAGRGSDKKEE